MEEHNFNPEENRENHSEHRPESDSQENHRPFHEPEHIPPKEPDHYIDNEPDKTNVWAVISAILGIIVVILLIMMYTGKGITGNVISENAAGDKVIEYLNTRTGGGIEYVSTKDIGNLYEVNVEYQGQEIPVYITKDGEYFVQGAVEMDALSDTLAQTQPAAEPPKSDKPIVELFVMTHCPYGTQAEKGILPVFKLLGDKIVGKIKFVHYFLHAPEETETPIQICIREEQSDKFRDYLSCFLEDGNSNRCLEETKIDKAKLNICVEINSEEYYDKDSQKSEDYGVRGSPTLIINGEMINSGRSPAAYLETICNAFNEAPEECSEELTTTNPSPGFGYTAQVGGSTNAQC